MTIHSFSRRQLVLPSWDGQVLWEVNPAGWGSIVYLFSASDIMSQVTT